MSVQLSEVIAADLFCVNWGLNPCLVICENCLEQSKKAMAQNSITDLSLYQDVNKKEKDKKIVEIAERLLREHA